MASVTVEGSLTPCVDLPRGVRRTYQLDAKVQKRIDAGYYTLIEYHPDEDDEPVELEEIPEENRLESSDGAPDPGATKKAWVEFVGTLKPPIEVPDGATRDQIVAAYEQYKQQVAGGS